MAMQPMQPMQAQDTFVTTLGDGTERLVTKGDVLPDSHELVKRDAQAQKANPDRTPQFRPLDLGEEEKAPAKSEPAKAEAKAPVKAAPKTAGRA